MSSRVHLGGSNINRWGFDPIFHVEYSRWNELNNAITNLALPRLHGEDEEQRKKREGKKRGEIFEQFAYFYLLYHKDLYGYEEVWNDHVKGREIPQSIHDEYGSEKKDHGIDLIAKLSTGGYEALQAKYRSDEAAPSDRELSTFWTEAIGKKKPYEQNRIIANCVELSPYIKKIKNQQRAVLKQDLSGIEDEGDFFAQLYRFATEGPEEITRTLHTPYPHQERMISDVVERFQSNDRGKLIAACGTGKTLAALWIVENNSLAAENILILAPSIELVGQTLKIWRMQSRIPFDYLVVCSDPTVDRRIDQEELNYDISTKELGFSVTTSSARIKEWLERQTGKRKYVFSTYHSTEAIEDAVKSSTTFDEFDLIVFDEAHRTVGGADSGYTHVALDNARVPSKKRLFMTATEKLIAPNVKTRALEAGVEVLSMDDVNKYGEKFHDLNFGKAINENLIADYQIILAHIEGDEAEAEHYLNKYVYSDEIPPEERLTREDYFKAGLLCKTITDGYCKKIISFHSRISRAKQFTRLLNAITEGFYIADVNGTQSAEERAEIKNQFSQKERGILCNVRCLSEGVDMPEVDTVFFCDRKESLIDLVQAIGRALRKPSGTTKDKVANIVVPINIPDDVTQLEDIDWSTLGLETFHHVIQAMRDQDAALHEEINQIVEYYLSGHRRGKRAGSGKINFKAIGLPPRIDMDAFIHSITIRIATANRDAQGVKRGFSHLGKGERGVQFTPVVKPIGDYRHDKIYEELIGPTLAKFRDLDSIVDTDDLKINNNNVSHTRRLGLIEQIGKRYRLTYLGRQLKRGNIAYDDLFVNQMFLYKNDNGIYPYREMLQVLLDVCWLTYHEFLYGPYSMQEIRPSIYNQDQVLERIRTLRVLYPRLSVRDTPVDLRNNIRNELNQTFQLEWDARVVWGDRTTAGNRWNYFKKHLNLLDYIDDKGGFHEPLILNKSRSNDLKIDLYDSSPNASRAPYGVRYWRGRDHRSAALVDSGASSGLSRVHRMRK